MRYIVSGNEMKLLDKNTSGIYKVPELVLMEQAAKGFVQTFSTLPISGRGIVFCGSGNNGADGLAIARLLQQKGMEIDICIVKEAWKLDGKYSASFLVQKAICDAYGYPQITQKEQLQQKTYGFVIDAVFGIGLSRELSEEYFEIIETINQIDAMHIAVDMPSGINADNGRVMGCAVRCDYTITFSYDKLGLRLWPGSDYAQTVYIVPIGIGDASWLQNAPKFAYLTSEDTHFLCNRKNHSNKGTYGKLLLIAGGTDMAGAAVLAAKAAYRSGVGLVKVFIHAANRCVLQTAVPEAVVCTYEDSINEAVLCSQFKWADAVVIGPGLGRTELSKQLVQIALDKCSAPLLLDADALNILAEHPILLPITNGNRVITPHLGEFARLTGKSIPIIQGDMTQSALEFAQNFALVCVLKDFHTIIANPNGLSYVNLSGNNGMATAGSGDVLSGIIGAFLAQGMRTVEAASYGVYVHGLAGDAAARQMGTHAVMASDIIEGLKEVWNKVENH